LRADQGNADALEVEPPLEEGAGDGGVTEPLAQVAQELERAQADRGVSRGCTTVVKSRMAALASRTRAADQ
jgi:hypothetical protein